MKIGISLKIDVTKIEKERIFQGQKGKYIDLTTFVNLDELDQYGNNGFIAHSVSKEEREQGIQGAIIGNTKVFYNDSQQAPQSGQGQRPQYAGNQQAPQQEPQPNPLMEDSIPF